MFAVHTLLFIACSVVLYSSSEADATTTLGMREFHRSYGVKLREQFITLRQPVQDRDLCKYTCQTKNQLVFQLERSKNSNDLICSCSRIAVKYLTSFPNRYLTRGDQETLYMIIFLQDVNDFQVPRFVNETDKPEVFIALDDISGGENLGTRANLSLIYSTKSGNGSPHYECPLLSDIGAISAAKVMQLIPQEKFIAAVKHNGTLKIKPEGLTVAIWFKPSRTDYANFPIVDAADVGWIMWNSLDSNQAECYSGWEGIHSTPYDQSHWTNIALRYSNAKLECSLNATQTTERSASQANSYGSHFNIGGRHYDDGQVDSRRFEGCVAHLMVFLRRMGDVELKKFTNLALDPFF